MGTIAPTFTPTVGFGAPSDSVYFTTPPDGQQYIDQVTNHLWERVKGVWVDTSSLGNLLGSAALTPALDNPNARNGTNTAYADVDAALAVTFITPPSGNVIVHLTGAGSTAGGTGNSWWSVREATTNVATAKVSYLLSVPIYMTVPFKITGLTAGTSHTYKWGAKTDLGSDAWQIAGGPTVGQLVMEVFAA